MAVLDVFETGDDQLASQFILRFPKGIPGATGSPHNIELRIEEEAPIPERGVQTYDVVHRGQPFPQPGGMEEVTKEVELIVRLGQQWREWDDLAAWMALVLNPKTGVPGSQSQNRTIMQYIALDRDESPVKIIEFQKTFICKMTPTPFNQNTPDPMRTTCLFKFLDFVVKNP